MTDQGRKFVSGWHQTPQHFKLQKYEPRIPSEKIMPVVDLRPFASPVVDQGNSGSCVACAYTCHCEWVQNKLKIPYTPLSILFAYMIVRKAERTWPMDVGASIIEMAKVSMQAGICAEDLWPYKDDDVGKNPPNIIACASDARKRLVTAIYPIRNATDAFNCIAEGWGVVGGVGIYNSWPGVQGSNGKVKNPDDKTGEIKMPKESDEFLGGHAVGFYGYNKLDQPMPSPTMKGEIIPPRTIIGKNSWGEDWGYKGWFFMPMDYFYEADLVGEFVHIVREKGGKS